MNAAMLKTLLNVGIACSTATVAGVGLGVAIHGWRALRHGLEPLFATYYAIPVYAFYPLFIVMFGLGDAPQILIGFMLAVVAVIMNTLNRPRPCLPRAAENRPHVSPRSVANRAAHHPAVRRALSADRRETRRGLCVHRRHRAEFIMSNTGVGYEISYAYNDFDNAIMYPLIVLILVVSVVVNSALSRWETALSRRRGRS